VLRGGGAGPVPHDPDDPYVRPLRGGRATAPLVGGCLWLLLQTMGTPWEVELEGAILFFEEVEAPPWYVDGMLTQLAQAGKLAGIAGAVVGDMDKCDWREQRPEWPRTKSLEQVLEEHLEPLGVPVLSQLPLGHAKHLAALPLGVQATLDGDARTLTIDQPALRCGRATGRPRPARPRPGSPGPAGRRPGRRPGRTGRGPGRPGRRACRG
jgi:muramoyltetrapeptide carboxypeptidase